MKIYCLLLLLLVICTLSAPTIFAQNNTQQKLSSITAEIKTLQQGIAHDKDSQKNLQNDLKKMEVVIGNLSVSLATLNHEMTQVQKNISELNTQISQLQQTLWQQETALNQQLRNTYQFGQDSAIKVLLNTETPDDLQRMMLYFRLLNQQKIQEMKIVKTNLDKMLQLQQHLQQKQQKLITIQQQQQALIHDLQLQQTARQNLITAINESLNAKTDKLIVLQQNRQSLEGLIQQLKQQPITTTIPPIGFARLRGHLPWPVNGKIVDRFGDIIEDSNLQWRGVLIATMANTPVHAIYPGRVIFADWLKGFGLLVIIDHGQNFMSLYGRNDALMVKTGDTVSWGQTIAKAGSTGGYNESGLYFEIRYAGDPLNPENWCSVNGVG